MLSMLVALLLTPLVVWWSSPALRAWLRDRTAPYRHDPRWTAMLMDIATWPAPEGVDVEVVPCPRGDIVVVVETALTRTVRVISPRRIPRRAQLLMELDMMAWIVLNALKKHQALDRAWETFCEGIAKGGRA